MSSFWRKIRSQSDEKLAKYLKNELEPKIVRSNTYNDGFLCSKSTLIKASDEELFLNADNDKFINSTHQLSRELDDILCNQKASSYFLEFLRQFNEEKNFFFLKDCLIYEDSFKNDNTEETFNKCLSSEIDCSTTTLPDLVCNIPENAISSPLPSPEEIEYHKICDFVCTDTEPSQLSDKTDNYKKCSDNESEAIEFKLATNIIKKYIDPTNVNSLKLSNEVVENIFSKILSGKSNLDNIFSDSKYEIMCLLKDRFLLQYLESEYYLRHQVDIFTGQTLTLQDILNCDYTLLYFMQFMEQENAQVLMEFWLSISGFRHQVSSVCPKNSEQLQTDAMILYDKYFSMQATCPMGFGHRIRSMVEENICKESGPDYSCFDLPFYIVLRVIERDYFQNYPSSFIHIKCLNEMINSMKIASRSHLRSGSTCSSENSHSTNKCTNTLLAMDTSCRGFANLNDSSNPMTIDSRPILDPDSLWRRKNYTKLSCGYIDKFGRFEAEMSPEPAREASKFSQKIKKFIKYEENKIKEEMAYKIAEMIIKDVMNITLPQEESPSVEES